jgi:hypothetical protein
MPRKGTREVRLRFNKWCTVATNFSLLPAEVHLEVWTSVPIKWRRFSMIPGFGKFRGRTSLLLPFGLIQCKLPENRSCIVRYGHAEEVKQRSASQNGRAGSRRSLEEVLER